MCAGRPTLRLRGMRTNILASTALAAALLPSAAMAKTGPVSYTGKTKEGTKVSFVLAHGWLEHLSTRLPTSCVSAQGGTLPIVFADWSIPYKFRLGATGKVKYGDPTRHYTITTRKHGKRVTGKLSINYSKLGSDSSGWKIYTCQATGAFDLKPRRSR